MQVIKLFFSNYYIIESNEDNFMISKELGSVKNFV